MNRPVHPIVAVVLLLGAGLALAAEPATRPVKKRDPVSRPAGVEPFADPLAYNGEYVEVTHSNTLKNRYASKDFQKDLDFYYARAEEASKGRTPGVIRIRQIFIKEIDVVGGQAEATCKIPEKFITEADEYQETLGKSFFAYSNGALRIQWLKPLVIDKVRYDVRKGDDLGDKWWFRPKKVEEQILPHLDDMPEAGADYFMFFLDYAVRNDNGKKVWPAYGGMSWAHETIKGVRMVTLNDHEIARGTHELGHQLYDTTVQDTESLTITRNHGMVDAGYFADDIWDPKARVGTLELGPVMEHYRDNMRYFYTRDMWERWRLSPPHNLQHEPFSGKAYQWADVKNDYWYKMPILRRDDLRKLTGLPNLTITTGEAFVIFDPGSIGGVQSPLLEGPVQKDLALNNALNLKGESAAVLKTKTGAWLFVRPPLVDVYVDMEKLRGNKPAPLPVYGTVLEDEKALVVIRVTDASPELPPDELGFFKPPPLLIKAMGPTSPGGSRFRDTLQVGIYPKAYSVFYYTLDGSEPTEKSARWGKPFVLTDTTEVRAAAFTDGKRVGDEVRRQFVLQPIVATLDNVLGSMSPYTIKGTATVKLDGGKWPVHYTLDGLSPTKDSPVAEGPLQIRRDTIVTAQCFDSSGKAVGEGWIASFLDRGYQKTLTTDKPITYSDTERPNLAEAVVDGFVDHEIGWWSKPAPQWLQVDLQGEFKVNKVNVVTYWDGSRYYQYTVELSVDGKDWKKVVDASANTTVATRDGYDHRFEATPARYIKLTMLKNSANPGLHVVELRAYEAK